MTDMKDTNEKVTWSNQRGIRLGLVHSRSPRQIMLACMARDVESKDVPEQDHVEW